MKKISVLFVCLGNICRSPAAEAIFISLLEKKGLTDGFVVDSAGTGSWHIGKKADSRMRIAAERRDINILSRARPVSYTHLRAHETRFYLVCRLLLELGIGILGKKLTLG